MEKGMERNGKARHGKTGLCVYVVLFFWAFELEGNRILLWYIRTLSWHGV